MMTLNLLSNNRKKKIHTLGLRQELLNKQPLLLVN
jgi:hypothetical protein